LLAVGYDTAPNPLLSLDRRTLPGLLGEVRGKRVADIAAGTGYWANRCAAQGAHAVAIDFCPEMLAQSHAQAILADARALPLAAASLDIAICAFGLGYAPAIFPELVRVTRPGGAVVVSDTHPQRLLSGWTRSFHHDGRVVEVQHHLYHFHTLQSDCLRREIVLEPHFGEPEKLIYEQSGKADGFDAAHPAIFAIRWRRL